MNKELNNQDCECGVSVTHTHGEGGLKDVRIDETSTELKGISAHCNMANCQGLCGICPKPVQEPKPKKCGKTLPTGYVCASELPCPLHTYTCQHEWKLEKICSKCEQMESLEIDGIDVVNVQNPVILSAKINEIIKHLNEKT
jgi:hypothetical protein